MLLRLTVASASGGVVMSIRPVGAAAIAFIATTTSGAAHAASGPDFNGDGFADLAIGTPFAGGSTGLVQVAYGSSAGLLLGPLSLLHVDLEGVPGNSKIGQSSAQR